MQIHKAQSKGTHLQNTGTPKAQETLQKRGPEYQGVCFETLSSQYWELYSQSLTSMTAYMWAEQG